MVIIKFRGDKIAHEHFHWDMATALRQIGALDAKEMPIAGFECARKAVDETGFPRTR